MYDHGNHTATANGHEITCSAWKSGSQINYSITIDGEHYTDGSSDDDFGRSTAESEAKLQAGWLAEEIESGLVRMIDGAWRLDEDEQIRQYAEARNG